MCANVAKKFSLLQTHNQIRPYGPSSGSALGEVHTHKRTHSVALNIMNSNTHICMRVDLFMCVGDAYVCTNI